jgi:hypothetical protein
MGLIIHLLDFTLFKVETLSTIPGGLVVAGVTPLQE